MKKHNNTDRPDNMKIGAQEYRIDYIETNNMKVSRFSPRYEGNIDYNSDTISILIDKSEYAIKNTILHEALHALDVHMGTSLDENQVKTLTNGILDMIDDNKSAFRYIFDMEGDDAYKN